MRPGTIALVALVTFGPAAAAQEKSGDVVKWTARAPAAGVRPGTATAVRLQAEIADGWHMYALTQLEGGAPPLEIALAKGQPFVIDLQRVDAPLPDVTKGAGSEPDTFHYAGKVALSVPVGATKTARPGKHTVPIEVTFQVCSGSICLRPATAVLPVLITVR